MQIIVLGMHRSGTSAVARLIAMMGAEIGPAHLIGAPAIDNEKGFWERVDVSRLNETVLTALDCAWDDVATFSPQHLERPELAEMRRQAASIIYQLDARRPWVLKDPRLCLTLPFWRPLLEVPVCVLPYRPPLEIAKSLRARNGSSIEHGIAIWERYTLAALESSQGIPRLGISYTDLIQEPVAAVQRLFDRLYATDVTGLRMPSKREILAFIDGQLRHQRAAEEEAADLLNPSQRRLAAALEEGSALDWKDIPELSAEAAERLLEHRQTLRASAGRGAAGTFNSFGEADETAQPLRRVGGVPAAVGRPAPDGAQDDADGWNKAAAVTRDEIADLTTQLRAAATAQAARTEEAAAETLAREDLQKRLAAVQEETRKLASRVAEIEQSERLATLQAQLQQSKADHRNKDEQIAFLSGELRLLTSWIEEIDRNLTATLLSWRWRAGHRAVSIVERLLSRPRPVLAADHLQNLLGHFKDWNRKSRAHDADARRNRTPATALAAMPPSEETPACRQEPLASYDLICFANIDWDARYQRPQQIAAQFARHGHRVFYVVASRSLPADDPQGFRATVVADGIYEVRLAADAVPDRYSRVLDAASTQSFSASLAKLREAFNIVDAVSNVHLAFWTPLARRLRELWDWRILYDCMDEWEDFPNIGKPLLAAERELVANSDVVAVTAALLEKKWQSETSRCVLIRNGVDFPFFRLHSKPSNILGDLDHPIIGFYGAIAEWVDLGLIAAVARARPEWQFVLLGDIFVTDLEGLDELPNVHLLGRRPYTDMPYYLYHFDVCLIPFRLNQVTHAVDPVKFYEYVSAGKPVVSVPLEELEIYRDYLYFGTTAADFVAQIAIALQDVDPARRQQRIELARANDWQDRYQSMAKAITEAHPRVSIVIVTYKNVELSQLCLESLLRNTTHPNYEIIVVDNDSRDGTANYLQYLQERHDNIRVIINHENRGFAAANNQGLAIATGDVLVLLNNDTVTPRGWLAPLLKHLQDGRIGLVGPVTNFVGNEAKIEVPYKTIEEMEHFAVDYMRGHTGETFDIGMLAMFCVAMTRDVFEEIGQLDETFGIGMFEDDDYSNRIKAQGYRVVCAKDSFVHHFGQAAFKKLIETGEYHEIWKTNQTYYEQKWGKWKNHSNHASTV